MKEEKEEEIDLREAFEEVLVELNEHKPIGVKIRVHFSRCAKCKSPADYTYEYGSCD